MKILQRTSFVSGRLAQNREGGTWIASKESSAEIAEFIELAVPNLPDSKLISSDLEELSSSVPELIPQA